MSWQRGCRNVFSDNEFLSVCKLCETFDQCLSNVSMKHWKTSKFHCREISTKRCCLSCAPMISLNFCFERKKIPGPSHSLKVFQTKATANKDLKFEILNSCRSIAVRWFFLSRMHPKWRVVLQWRENSFRLEAKADKGDLHLDCFATFVFSS